MPTEFLTAVATEGVALFHRGEAAAESLRTFLQGKGYRVFVTGDPRQLIELMRGDSVDIALVAISDSAEDRAMLSALQEGYDASPVVAMCERTPREPLCGQQPGKRGGLQVLSRPVPFARILGTIEKQLSRRVRRRATGQQPALLFASMLADLWREQRSGRLQVIVNGVQTTIYLREGVPIFAEQGSLEDTLGRMLVRTERITHEDFSRAVSLITDRMVDNEQMRLGEALIELGILSAKDIEEALKEQVRRKILACFRAQRFHSDFREGQEFLEAVGDFSSPMEQLLTEGMRTVDPERLSELLQPMDPSFAVLDRELWEIGEAFALNPREQSFVLGINGDKTLRQLREGSQLDRIHACQLLCALMLGSAFTLHDEPRATKPALTEPSPDEAATPSVDSATPKRRSGSAKKPSSTAASERNEESTLMALYSRVKGRSDHGVLEVERDASPQQIEQAFKRRTRELEAVKPKKGPANPGMRRALDALSSHVRSARDRLLSGKPHEPDRRQIEDDAPARDEKRGRLLAEEAYQAALGHYKKGELSEGLGEANKAVRNHPEPLDYQLLQAWLAYLCSSEGKAKQKSAIRAFDCARRMFNQDGTSVLANLVLGHMLARQGKRERSRRHLILAVRDNAEDWPQIQAELKGLDQERGDPARHAVQAGPKKGRKGAGDAG